MGNAHEFSHHVELGHDLGVSDDDVHVLIADTAGRPTTSGELDRLVLAAAREMTADGSMTDQTWKALSKHLEVARLVELVIVSTFYGAITRVLSTLQVDMEPKYGGYLQTFP